MQSRKLVSRVVNKVRSFRSNIMAHQVFFMMDVDSEQFSKLCVKTSNEHVPCKKMSIKGSFSLLIIKKASKAVINRAA